MIGGLNIKTIKQIADELGVSKTAIRKRLTEEFREKYTQKLANGVVCVLPDGEIILRESFADLTANRRFAEFAQNSGNQFAVVSGEVSALITMLQRELDAKNTEIERLHKIIEREQQARLEAAATDPPAGGFFARLFGTKK